MDATILMTTLALTLILFIWGYFRYDVIAMLALMSLVVIGIIPSNEAFTGFSNPAVVTVACVMVITQTITDTGIVDTLVNKLTPITEHLIIYLASLMLVTAVLSAFMNNIGALALMMPIALKTAALTKRSPSLVLMPLAFGSVLGGMTTSIGTPPNLLISAYREQITGHQFAMFDFSPVGIWVAMVSLIFIALIGWRLIPLRLSASKDKEERYHIEDYIAEISIPETSPMVGKSLAELENLTEGDFSVLGLIRNRRKRLVIPPSEELQAKDILIIESAHDELEKLVSKGGLAVYGTDKIKTEQLKNDDIMIVEAVVPPGSRMEGRSWQRMRIRSRYRINLLAIARSGRQFKKRLNHANLSGGDVVLVQGHADGLQENIINMGLVPLAERGVSVGMRKKAYLPPLIFGIAIALTAVKIFNVQIAFTLAIIVMLLLNVLPARKVYQSIDWSIIVLLASLIPIGNALQSTGGTQILADMVLGLAGSAPPLILIGLLLLITMTLSDIMNNAATAVVMAPIAVTIAQTLNASIDPFLMAVAIGASCSFLTPISHQNNTIVMGPGGYKFFDYARLGLPIEFIVLIIATPMILWIWPM